MVTEANNKLKKDFTRYCLRTGTEKKFYILKIHLDLKEMELKLLLKDS